MSILKMKRVTIGGLKSEKDDIMYLLQRMNVMEITEVVNDAEDDAEQRQEKEPNPELIAIRKTLSDIDQALSKIGPFHKKKGLAKPEYKLDQVNSIGKDRERLDKLLSDISAAERQMGELKSRKSGNEKIIAQLKPFEGLGIPVEEIGRSSSTTSVVGFFPTASVKALESLETGEYVYFEQLSEDRDSTYYFFVIHNDVYDDVLNELRNIGFAGVDLSAYKGVPKDIVAACKKEDKEIQDSLENAGKVYEELAGDYEFLMVSADYYGIQEQRLESEEKSDDTKNTFFVTGWVIARNVENLRKSLENLSPNCFMEDRDPTDDEFIPTALQNNKIVKPYEAVTDLYSPPDARGFDPNSVMAPFFFIFIGMMVSDAAYGILLTIACIVLLKIMKPGEGMMSKILKVVAMGGISTLIWGAIYGSWFAFTPPEGYYLVSQMNEPLLALVICYALGVIHLFTGHFVNMYIAIRDGDVMGAFMDTFTWILWYAGLTVWLVSGAAPMLFGIQLSPVVGQIGRWMTIVGAVSLILTQGRAKKNIIGKFISGLLSLYDTSGYLSDVLSYSRLFAMGLATGVVGMVVNTIVGMLMGNPVGMVFGVIVFIAGHTVNIAINVLGAYVHASRLQYIEYYGKFYQDGGEKFKPLSLKTKHIKLT